MTIKKLWVDDERPAPDESWDVAKTADEAIKWLYGYRIRNIDNGYDPSFMIYEVSLDHDLGGDDTGFKVLDWMIEHNVWPKILTIHTSNPPARQRMLAAANAEAPPYVEIYVIYDHLSKD